MLRVWLSRLLATLHRRRLDEEMDEEIRTHLEMAAEEYMRQGMSPEGARRAARRSFGGVEQVRERQRETRGLAWLDELLRDLRLATRALAKDRAFALTAVLTLTIAIGANTAIVSVVDAVLLRPLPYPDADDVVTVGIRRTTGERTQGRFTIAAYGLFREESRSFEGLGAYNTTQAALTGRGEPMQASVSGMTNSAFAVLGLSPQLGRLPAAEEDLPGARRVVVLSHDLWSRRFASDPGVVGRTIELNDTLREVVGVMPEEFGFPSRQVDAWVPLQLDLPNADTRSSTLGLIGRLRPDATPESASADADRLIQRLPEVGHSPVLLETILEGRASLLPLKEDLVGGSRDLLLVLLGAVSIVLLIALANVSTLFIARGEERTHQRLVRSVLGASRRRLVQHASSEALLLSLGGGLAGVLLALVGTRTLVDLAPPSIPRLEGVGASVVVLGHAMAMSLAAAVVFSVAPALGTRSATRPASGLSTVGRTATAGPARLRLRSVLVATQIGLAAALLIGSVLMVRSYERLRSVDPGFEPADLVTFGLMLPPTRYSSAEAADLYQRLTTSLGAMPDIQSAAVTTGLPVTPRQASYRLEIEGFPDGVVSFVMRTVTPGYFETMGIPVLAGRTMLSRDYANPLRFFVTESFADQYLGGAATAVGRLIGPREGGGAEVLGVVGDDQIRGLDIPTEAAVYAPIGALGSVRSVSVVVRTGSAGTDVAPLLRRAVAALDPGLPLIDIRSMEDVISESYAVSRTSFAMMLLVTSALVALMLGAVGIYGVITHSVSRRTAEIGIRIALGATSGKIITRIASIGMMPALLGLGAGSAIAVVASQGLSSLLFETERLDPSAFLIGPGVLLLVACVACLAPTRRAIAIDPVRALRSD